MAYGCNVPCCIICKKKESPFDRWLDCSILSRSAFTEISTCQAQYCFPWFSFWMIVTEKYPTGIQVRYCQVSKVDFLALQYYCWKCSIDCRQVNPFLVTFVLNILSFSITQKSLFFHSRKKKLKRKRICFNLPSHFVPYSWW